MPRTTTVKGAQATGRTMWPARCGCCRPTHSSWMATTTMAGAASRDEQGQAKLGDQPRCRSLPLRYQLFGDLRLSLQPRQSRLLVHASNGLAGGKSPTHGSDHLAVGLLTALASCRVGPGWQQVESSSHLGSGHDRVGAAAMAACGLTVGAHQDREQTLYLGERSGGGPAEGAAISHCSPRSN